MIWFWIVAVLLVLMALAALLQPLIRRARRSADEAEPAVTMFRRQLAEIDAELEQGRLAPDETAAVRTELTRRMLAAAERDSADLAAGAPAELSWRIGAAVGIAGLLPAAALGIYLAVGSPAAINSAAPASAARGTGPHDLTQLAAAADRLKARLERDPDHVEGWALLGRTLSSLQRFAEARDAYGRAIALQPDDPGLHAELGEVLVLAAEGTVTAAAQAEFAKSGSDPRARFYGAEAALQHGDAATARAGLEALLADAPPDAPWRNMLAARLAELAPGEAPPGGQALAGPTSQDLAAARSMSPEQRQAMIRGMVERLAARLEQNPDDQQGWVRLARAYEVLGDADKAKAALARAAAAGATAPGR